MLDLACMANICLPAFIASKEGIFTIVFSILLLGISHWKIRKKETVHRTFWIYAHLFAVTLPIFYFLFASKCGSIFSCNAAAFIFSIPVSILGTVALGYIIAPWIYQHSLKTKEVTNGELYNTVKNLASPENIKMPKLFLVDEIKPTAFSSTSITPKIFFSVGMLEILTKKEFEAVLLHELYHIKTKTPKLKSLGFFLGRVSPVFAFSGMSQVLSQEETNADYFAVQKQKTRKHINKAKFKLNEFSVNYKNEDSAIHSFNK